MGQAQAYKGTKLTKARAVDTTQEEIKIMEGQLTDLKCSYEGWINMVTKAALQEQHQMTECDIQARLEVLCLVYEEPQRLLMAMEEDPSQQAPLKQQQCNSLLRPWKTVILN